MNAAIETAGLTKHFFPRKAFRKTTVKAVEDVSLQVRRGELFALLGPNGAGKTTLLKLLCTLILPTSGSARLNGYDLSEDNEIKKSIGLVTGDERSFYWRLSGRENLYFFAALHDVHAEQVKRSVEELAGLLEISGLDRRVQEYSTGMKQRLALALGLLGDPPVLLMDEPTRSLDPSNAHKLRMFIRETLCRKHGKTVFFTTHQLDEAEGFSDRMGVMHRGVLKGCGTLEELRGQAKTPGASLREVFERLTGVDP